MNLYTLITIRVVVFLLLILLIFLASCYKKVGPNQVLIVTGGHLSGPFLQENPDTHTKVKVVKGGGTFVIPIIQQAEVESLDIFRINVAVEDVKTSNQIPVDAQANAVLRVGSDPQMIAIASEKLLGLSEEERTQNLTDIVRSSIRDTLSQMTPKDANDRTKFGEAVIDACKPKFDKLGLEISNLAITDIDDKNGYYQALAAPEMAQKQADARKAQAESEQEASIAEAEARKKTISAQEQNRQEAEIAKLTAQNEINAKQRDVDVAKAQFQASIDKENAKAAKAGDIAKAEQDAIIQEKQIQVAANKYKATVIAEQNANNEAQKSKADANYEIAKRNADANKYAAQQKADAMKYSTLAEGDAQSEKIAKIGNAKAENQEKMAKALAAAGSEQSLASKIIDILPEINKSNAEAMGKVKKLTILNGAKGYQDTMASNLTGAIETIKNVTGIDIADIVTKRANGQLTIDNNSLDKLKDGLNKQKD